MWETHKQTLYQHFEQNYIICKDFELAKYVSHNTIQPFTRANATNVSPL